MPVRATWCGHEAVDGRDAETVRRPLRARLHQHGGFAWRAFRAGRAAELRRPVGLGDAAQRARRGRGGGPTRPARRAGQSCSLAALPKVLREALYRIFATRPSADPLDLDLLQSEVRAAQEARMLLPDADGYAWRWRADDPDTVCPIASPSWPPTYPAHPRPRSDRVHICPGEELPPGYSSTIPCAGRRGALVGR